MAEYMTPEREEYIAKLDEQIQVIDRILKMDLGSVVSAELKKQLITILLTFRLSYCIIITAIHRFYSTLFHILLKSE